MQADAIFAALASAQRCDTVRNEATGPQEGINVELGTHLPVLCLRRSAAAILGRGPDRRYDAEPDQSRGRVVWKRLDQCAQDDAHLRRSLCRCNLRSRFLS